MNRRNFLTTAAAAAFVSTLPLSLTGCNTTTIADFVNVIATDAGSLATFFGDTGLAGQITTLAARIAADIASWQNGTSGAAAVIAAINDLIGLVDLIPIAQPYAPLIVLILSALTGLLALIPQAKVALDKPLATKKYTVTPTNYGGYDKKHMTAGRKSFESQWKTLSTGLPTSK